MTQDDIDFLISTINSEGLDYSMVFYSTWEEIDDKEFQKLRKKYIKVRNQLDNYIKTLTIKQLAKEN